MHRRHPMRVWRFGLAVLSAIIAIGILLLHLSAVLASHPAYLVTLVLVAGGAVAIALTSVFEAAGAPPRPASEASTGWPRRVLHTVEVVGVVALLSALLYLRPLPASSVAVDAMHGSAQVTVTDSATRIELRPSGTAQATGLVFYPGALVDPRAYVPNLTPLAATGFPVVILKLPYNIAFFDPNGATKVMDSEPQITRWVVGGHSLGGVVASSVAGGDDLRVRGLLLWASYPNSSIAAKTSLQVTSISASNDALATPAKIDASKQNLPPDTRYVVIEGGVHAFFGDYGEQSGDGTPSVTREVAQRQIQAASLELLERVDRAA